MCDCRQLAGPAGSLVRARLDKLKFRCFPTLVINVYRDARYTDCTFMEGNF